jgi:hypothetical protein
MGMKIIICSLFITAVSVFAQQSGSDFLSEESRDFKQRADAMAQQMDTDVLQQRVQRLENERAAELHRQQIEEAKRIEWERKADASLNAAWNQMKTTLLRQYPDLKNPKSPMFQLYQHIAQNYRILQNPILFDPSAPKLIADSAAIQLEIAPLPVASPRPLW